jgi:hypothetical protein
MSDIETATLLRIEQTSKATAAAALAGGIIASSGRPHSPDEALSLYRDVFFAMWPSPGNGGYQSFQNEQRGAIVHR